MIYDVRFQVMESDTRGNFLGLTETNVRAILGVINTRLRVLDEQASALKQIIRGYEALLR